SPHLVRNAPRSGVVEATDESPQPVADNEGNTHGGADSHVCQVFEVNGRDATQHRKAEVEWPARVRAEGGDDPRRRGAGIEYQPQPVLEVQLTRLGRDVGGWIVQSQIGLKPRCFRL